MNDGVLGENSELGDDELVVLLDESGRPCGSAPKATVHHQHTPLHLAFSCWVTDAAGRILLTRRAWSKPTWPEAWTNAFCGHPRPGESITAAVSRRARDELGVAISEPTPVLPAFRYRAVMANGVVENEVCPVFTAQLLTNALAPVPGEVAEYRWLSADELRHHLDRDADWLSAWARLQLSELAVVVPGFRGLSPRPILVACGDPDNAAVSGCAPARSMSTVTLSLTPCPRCPPGG